MSKVNSLTTLLTRAVFVCCIYTQVSPGNKSRVGEGKVIRMQAFKKTSTVYKNYLVDALMNLSNLKTLYICSLFVFLQFLIFDIIIIL